MKKTFLFILIGILTLTLFSTGCILIPADILYDYGLTGDWATAGATANNLTIENEIASGRTIDTIKYYAAASPATEPSWSSVTNYLPSDIAYGDSRSYVIANYTGLNTCTIWVRVESGVDYLVGAFEYDSTNSNAWYLTVYDKL